MATRHDKSCVKSRIAFVIAAAALAAAIVVLITCLNFTRAANPSPTPNGVPETTAAVVVDDSLDNDEDDDEFPVVDWGYWLGVNVDVVGWITIPGTDVDHPILQAHQSDPDYYLHHDVYGNYNSLGAIYVDAECEDEGLSSKNAVLLGHNIQGTGAIARFGVIANYKDGDFAAEHQTVLIQTPLTKKHYEVRFANIVKGWEPTKRTSFVSDEDFSNWYDTSRSEAVMVLDDQTEPEQTISLVSCSYNYWPQNERTVVTTSIDPTEANLLALSGQVAVDGI